MSDTPKNILNYLAVGLQRKLGLSETQTFVSATDIDAVVEYFDLPLIVVVQGPVVPDPQFQEAGQVGSTLDRMMTVSLHCYVRFKLDQHGVSREQIIRDTEGLIDYFEKIKDTLAFTYLGNGTDTFVLNTKKLWWAGETPNITINEQTGIVKRVINYYACYGEAEPDQTTLTLDDVQ